MRLQAAVSLLHLCTVEVFANVINSNFIWLAITAQVWVLVKLTYLLIVMHIPSGPMLPCPNHLFNKTCVSANRTQTPATL